MPLSATLTLYGKLFLRKTLSTSRERADLRATDFPRTRLALLDENVEASIRCKQHSNAVGALKLQAQLIRKPRDTAVTTTSQPEPSPDQGDDWWTLQRKQQGEIRAREREARLQREREERGEDQKLRNRLHWEKMRRATQDDPGQS